MRIIAGAAKGRRLKSPQGINIRPTSDLLREAIFSMLEATAVEWAHVVDFYAGTGALGIEALSRKAESAVFIDNSKAALSAIKNNITSCAFENRAIIVKWDIKKNLNCLKSTRSDTFSLVFLDPPYNKGLIEPSLVNLGDSAFLRKDAIIVVEHSSFEPIPIALIPFEIADQRKYGKTLVSFLNYVV